MVSFKETVDMTQEEFYDKLRATKVHPKTSQPAIGEMVALYEKLQEQGYDCAIALHVVLVAYPARLIARRQPHKW